MMGMIIIVCNGDHDKMKYKISSLTWLEEWVLYFEVVWGRTMTRWDDIAKEYKMNGTICREFLIQNYH